MMPPFVKKKVARSHQDALKTVCAACWRKPAKVSGVSDRVADQIRQFVFKDYLNLMDITLLWFVLAVKRLSLT